MDLVESRRSRAKQMKRFANLLSVGVLLTVGSCLVWLYGSDAPATFKLNIVVGVWLAAPLVSVIWRSAIGALGLRRLLREDWLDSMAQVNFPKAGSSHEDVEQFLADVAESSDVPIETRLIASRWLGQISVKRSQYLFANVEAAALDEAFADYKRLGVGTSVWAFEPAAK